MSIESIVLLLAGAASAFLCVLLIHAGAGPVGIALCVLVMALAAGCLLLGWRFWRHPLR